MTDFGKAIQILRIENDRKQKQDAEDFGATASYISAIESGKKKITDNYLEYCINTYGNKDMLTELAEKQNHSTYVFKDVDNGLDLVCRAINEVKDDEWSCAKDMLLDMVVVRCKDCKFYHLENGIDEYECTNSEGIMWIVTDGDYCSRGERKEK